MNYVIDGGGSEAPFKGGEGKLKEGFKGFKGELKGGFKGLKKELQGLERLEGLEWPFPVASASR